MAKEFERPLGALNAQEIEGLKLGSVLYATLPREGMWWAPQLKIAHPNLRKLTIQRIMPQFPYRNSEPQDEILLLEVYHPEAKYTAFHIESSGAVSWRFDDKNVYGFMFNNFWLAYAHVIRERAAK